MSEPVVGIAVPTLDAGDHLLEALRSIQGLRLPFTAVVQDAGSSDGSFERARELLVGDDRFVLRSEPDDGQADAIERAWSLLPGDVDLLTWVNADDLLHPHGFAAAVARARAHPDVAAVYGDFLVIDEQGLVVELIRRPRRVSRIQLVYNECLVPGVAPVLRREAVAAVGGLDRTLHYGLDYDLFIRLAEWGPLVRTPHIVASFRAHAGSKTMGDRADRSVEESERIRARYRRLPAPLVGAARVGLRAKIRAQRMAGRLGMVERFGDEPPPHRT